MNSKLYVISLAAVLASVILTFLYKEREVNSLKSQLLIQSHQLDLAQQSAASRYRETATANETAQIERKRNAETEAESAKIEDALDAWIGKVKRLSDYLNLNPDKFIPQMKLLTTEEWLDATKGADFQTEADYRKALAHLRGLARLKVAPSLGKAWNAAIAENGGNIPTDVARMAVHLPIGFDPSILTQLQLNPSGEVSGLRTSQKFYLVDKPVDLWDATLFYAQDGQWGSRSAESAEDRIVRNAMKRYADVNGHLPASLSQIRHYVEVAAGNNERLQQAFNAITTIRR